MITTGKLLQQRYRIDRQIGQGGMGAVYIATDERFGSVVAIKETLCMDDNFRKAIEREARLLNGLNHTALPRVTDHFEEDDGQFLVMEYIPGEEIAAMLESDREAFPVDRVLKWADELLDALDYLHNQEVPVVHRDVKPQNLKLNARGQVILLDFGLAKGNPTDAGRDTAAKSIFGYSRNYASLEQIQGTGTDPRSDLYSLAATLYHLLTGTPPEDALTRAMAVLTDNPDPLVPANVINPKVPVGVAGILHKALALNAAERPASAVAMREMLGESEKYAGLAEPDYDGKTVHIHSAPATRFASDGTGADSIKPTDMKTEVLPYNISERTRVGAGQRRINPALQLKSPPVRSMRDFAVPVLAGLFAISAIAAGIFIFKPSVFGVEQKAVTPVSAASVVDANNAGSSNSAIPLTLSSANSNTAAIPSVPAGQTETAGVPLDSKSNQPPTAETAKTQPVGTGAVDSKTAEQPVAAGPVGDENKRNTLTSVYSPPPSTPQPQNTPQPVVQQRYVPRPQMEEENEQSPLGIDTRGLTPEQRQMLNEAFRNGRPPPPRNPPPRRPPF